MNLLFANFLMFLHFLWVAFMILGLPLGLWLRSPLLRWLHFAGMSLTALLALVGAFCPLTVWEDLLRAETDPSLSQHGSFLARHLSAVLYPAVKPWILRAASVMWGGITVAAMILVPPGSRVSPARAGSNG